MGITRVIRRVRRSAVAASVCAAALTALLLAGPAGAWAQGAGNEGSPVATAQRAATTLQQQMAGPLSVQWTGRSSSAGEMLEVTLHNSGDQPLQVRLAPGLVLEPKDAGSQRLMVESAMELSVPGGGTVHQGVRAYCLDAGREPPQAGQKGDYSLASDLQPYSSYIRVVAAGLRLSSSGRLHGDMPNDRQRTVAVQQALWTVPGGALPPSKESLVKEMQADERDVMTAPRKAGGVSSQPTVLLVQGARPGQLERMADHILLDIKLILKEAASL
jgi:hypothetical protein